MKKRIAIFLFVFMSVSMITQAQSIFDLIFGGSPAPKKTATVKFADGDPQAEDEVMLISINGPIFRKVQSQNTPFSMPTDLIKNLKKDLAVVRERTEIKAVLLEIDSPGGEITASDIVYNLILKCKKETGKPVVAIFGSLGASGAYYVACSADKIMAHPTSIVGSIGVIMQSLNIEELAKKIGISPVTLKSDSTPMKDILSPYRPMTEEERASLLAIIDAMYNRFVKIVADSRKMKFEDAKKISTGAMYIADKAKELGLLDSVGYREDALEEIKTLIESESVKLVERKSEKSMSDILSFFTGDSMEGSVANLLHNAIMFGGYPTAILK
ncbi:MAG: signal peptide peptidase SppA [Candidatus Riflebacteria bacterium]|nr:signal peptide peptidase SppA [Candidatus Riflebacteria bacterium]